MKTPRNPHHDIPGVQCICKKCREYRQAIEQLKTETRGVNKGKGVAS